MKRLTKEQAATFPKTMIARHFKEGSDTRDKFNELHAFETVVNDKLEEAKFFEGLNHEANIVIDVKLNNGIII